MAPKFDTSLPSDDALSLTLQRRNKIGSGMSIVHDVCLSAIYMIIPRNGENSFFLHRKFTYKEQWWNTEEYAFSRLPTIADTLPYSPHAYKNIKKNINM